MSKDRISKYVMILSAACVRERECVCVASMNKNQQRVVLIYMYIYILVQMYVCKQQASCTAIYAL